MAVALGPDGLVATASRDHTARLWDAGASERRRFAHDDWVIAVALSADGRRIATGCRDLTARVWDAASGAEVARLPLGAMPWAVGLDADGDLLTVGCADGTARVWDVAGRSERACLAHDTGVVAVAFDEDGAVLATAVRDAASVWDPAGRELERAAAPGAPIMAVGFGPNRRLLGASAGHDGIARVCDLASGRELARIEPPSAVTAIAFDGAVRRIATAGRDGTARPWVLE
jgi:WD40 repeat protein